MANAKPVVRILGIMTGTSSDALDGACIELSPEKWRPLWSFKRPYPPGLRRRVLNIQLPGSKPGLKEMLDLERDLGDWYGRCAVNAIHNQAASLHPHAIANHGQTLAHHPAPRSHGTTYQAGDPAHIASRTGLTVISHFRNGDMAAGGEGAPLLPRFHRWIVDSLLPGARGVAIHNLGGISNLTYVPPKGEILAFDTGPANTWIDSAVEAFSQGKLRYDRGGSLARKGLVDAHAVKIALKHPFFKKAAPKSTGRDDFPYSWFKRHTRASGLDLVATATQITIESVASAYKTFILKRGLPLERILVCGGGANNMTLMKGLAASLAPIHVGPISEIGLDSQLIEAQGFAYFGLLALCGTSLGGSWTGTSDWAPPARITPGRNWLSLIERVQQFHS